MPKKKKTEKRDLFTLFNPESVAVLGASNSIGKWGYSILINILKGGYPGDIYPINLKEKSVLGLPAYPSLADIGKPVDLTIVIVPARGVHDILLEAAAADCRNLVVISSNFGETGPEGKRAQARLQEIADEHQLNVVGPNTMGILSLPKRLHAAWIPDVPLTGKVGMVSQSGNLGNQLLDWGLREGIGFSRYVGSGNEAVLKTYDFLDFFLEDPETDVVALYMEGIDDGEKLLASAERLSRVKPIVALKTGRTATGARAVSSHTGAMTGSHDVFAAALEQAGVVVVRSTQQLVNVTRAFTRMPLPAGNRVGVMTLGGGWGVVTADACAEAGLELPELADQSLQAISAELPEFWSRNNPVDLVGSFKRKSHLRILRTLASSDKFDAVINLGIIMSKKTSVREISDDITGVYRALTRNPLMPLMLPASVARGLSDSIAKSRASKKDQKGKKAKSKEGSGSAVDFNELLILADGVFAEKIRETVLEFDKPIMTVQFHPDKIDKLMQMPNFLSYDTPEKAVSVLAHMVNYAAWRRAVEPEGTPEKNLREVKVDKSKAAKILDKASGTLSEDDSRKVLEAYGISGAPGGVAATCGEALRIADSIGYPVALKVSSPDIAHKTEAGAIRLNVADADALREAYDQIIEAATSYNSRARIAGVLVQSQLRGGFEVICGGVRDPQFGPVIAFGLGGVFTEVLADLALAVSPFSRATAEATIDKTRAAKIFRGVRGNPPLDREAVAEVLMKLQRLMVDFKNISEIDINPLMVNQAGEGVVAADALITLA